jgi:hypothetical protein
MGLWVSMGEENRIQSKHDQASTIFYNVAKDAFKNALPVVASDVSTRIMD